MAYFIFYLFPVYSAPSQSAQPWTIHTKNSKYENMKIKINIKTIKLLKFDSNLNGSSADKSCFSIVHRWVVLQGELIAVVYTLRTY